MQIWIGAGLPSIGEAFPRTWNESIRQANPKGFYESRLREGVFYATNPDPQTGAYLAPDATRQHVVKVFIPGVVRTAIAFLHRVGATLRHWRSYCRSLHRLYTEEDAWLRQHPPPGMTPEQALAAARKSRGNMPAPVEWFRENYDLIRDFAVRRYPINLVTYERLIETPEPVVQAVLNWIGRGDLSRALAVIDPDLSRSPRREPAPDEDAIDSPTARVFDDLHAAIHRESRIPRSLLADLNATERRLREEYGALARDRGRDTVERDRAT